MIPVNEPTSLGTGEGGLLESCPRCRYSLHGLPLEHRCPECGLGFDRRWQVFGGRAMKGWLIGRLPVMYLVFAVVALNGVMTLSAVMIGGGPGIRMVIFFIPAFVVPGVMAWFVMRTPKSFVALGPRGLFIHRRARRFEIFPWEDIRRAHYDLLRKRVNIARTGGDVHLEAIHFFGANTEEIDRCVQAINRYPRPAPPAAPPR